MTTTMSETTTWWMRRAVVGLAGFAFVGNAGHAFEMLHGQELANQPVWLAVGGALLPDVLLLVSVIRLRHGLRSFWGWLGLLLAGSFVLWSGLITADHRLVAQIASAWPLAVAITAAGLLEYGDRQDQVTEATEAPDHRKIPDRVLEEMFTGPDQVVPDPKPVPAAKTTRLTVVSTVGKEDQRTGVARDWVNRFLEENGRYPGKRPLVEYLRESRFPTSPTTASDLLVQFKQENEQEAAHG